MMQNVESIKQQLKLVKRRLPQDISITKCNMAPKTLQNLKQTADQLNKVMNLVSQTAKHTVQLVSLNSLNEASPEISVSHEKLFLIWNALSEKIYEQDDRGVSQNIRNVLSSTNTDMSQLAQFLLDHEYEIMSNTTAVTNNVPPIVLRAQIIKKQLEETKTLTATLENKDSEIRQLKLNAKLKQNELSEMQIRKDLAEKKLSVLQQDHESNTSKLQKQIEETQEALSK